MFVFDEIAQHTRCVGMARRSTDEEKQQMSIADQVDQINQSCDEHLLKLCREFNPSERFSERGIVCRDGSGLSFDRRDFDLAVSFCLENKISHIVVTSLDRFSREDGTEFGKRLDTLADNGIDLLICTDLPRTYDLSKGSVRQELIKKSEWSHMVSVQTAETVIVRKRNRAKNMLIPIAPAFGYDVDKGDERRADGRRVNGKWKVIPIKTELEALRKCGQMFIDGESTTAIVSFMQSTGLMLRSAKHKKGNPNGWTWASLKRILKNPCYVGDYVQFKWKSGKLRTAGASFNVEDFNIYRKKGSSRRFKTRMEAQPEENQTIIKLEDQTDGEFNNLGKIAIFSKEEFTQINDRLRLKHQGKRTRTTNRKYFLTSKGRCAHCGGPLFGNRSQGKEKYNFYFCANARNSKSDDPQSACPGGNKTIPEKELIRAAFSMYYSCASDDTERVISETKEKLKEMSASTAYRDLKQQLADWTDYKHRLIDDGKIDGLDFQKTEARLAKIEKELSSMSFANALSVERYDGDEYSLTSEVVAATQGDATSIEHKAMDLADWALTNEVPASQELIDDVLESFRVEWLIDAGRNKPVAFDFTYRLGWSAQTFELQHLDAESFRKLKLQPQMKHKETMESPLVPQND